MTPQSLEDKSDCTRESEKFLLDANGNVCVRVCSEDISINAPTGPFLVTTKIVTDTAALIVASDLSDRVTLAIRNLDTTNIVYMGPTSGVVSGSGVGTTAGWEIDPNQDQNIDLAAGQVIYLICESGKTAKIKIIEVAST